MIPMNEPTMDPEALAALTDPDEVQAAQGALKRLEKDTDILLFIAPGCPVCPHQVRSVATLALASPHIGLEIVDVSQERDLAMQYEIRNVPTTVVDDELVLVGMVPAPELAWRLLERQGPEAEKMVFASLVHSGRHADAAERLADGRATDAFLELWEGSSMEARVALMLVAEDALLYDPDGLNPLVGRLVAALEGDGPLSQDDARRGDTADLLGRIGHADARPALERLMEDPNEEVVWAAEEALAALDEGRSA